MESPIYKLPGMSLHILSCFIDQANMFEKGIILPPELYDIVAKEYSEMFRIEKPSYFYFKKILIRPEGCNYTKMFSEYASDLRQLEVYQTLHFKSKTSSIVGLNKKNVSETISHVKQNLFLFDEVGISMSSQVDFDYYTDDSRILGLLNSMKEQHLIYNPYNRIDELLNVEGTLAFCNDRNDTIHSLFAKARENEQNQNGWCRYASAFLNLFSEVTDFTAVPFVNDLRIHSSGKSSKTDVLNLIIKNLPIPDPNTPLADIIEFRADKNNKGRYASLKVWINNAVRSEKAIGEIKDELDDLLFRYRRSLESHKIKYRLGLLQRLAVAGIDYLQDPTKFKLSSAVEQVFSVRKEKMELLDTELNSAGNEIAYIYEVQDKFG